MASGILGQAAPSAASLTDTYTVPEGFEVSLRVDVCERGNSATTVRLALRQDGSGLGNEDYVAYDHALAANGRNTYGPYVLSGGDVVTVYGASANTSWTVTGIEKAIS